jgi:hypothetical protein
MTKEDYCVPTMETHRIKLGSDGTLDKLKSRIAVRGDFQNKENLRRQMVTHSIHESNEDVLGPCC